MIRGGSVRRRRGLIASAAKQPVDYVDLPHATLGNFFRIKSDKNFGIVVRDLV